MLLSDFDFSLPDELIAQVPTERRDESRMLVVERATNTFYDAGFADLPKVMNQGDLLIANNTKVFPARLNGKTETGAAVEVFLVRDLGDGWEVLAKPTKRLRIGKRIDFEERLSARVIGKTEAGRVIIEFPPTDDLELILDEIGKTPLPPYIKRDVLQVDGDRDRYQTIYAKQRGSIAAPTAGLHFTPEVLKELEQKGVERAEITLHVGYGTFEPVRVDELSKHHVSPEDYSIDEQTAASLNTAKNEGRRIVAVGTTTTRALESNYARHGEFTWGSQLADLTITPGHNFQAVDALLTNFHLPRSSLFVLTSSFGGHELIMNAYRHAVAENYRFYSYGDCMLIL